MEGACKEGSASAAQPTPLPADTLKCVPTSFLGWVALLVGVGLGYFPGRLV